MSDSHVTVLPDDRELGWLEMGDPDGSPVFAFHGTPGSREQLTIAASAIRDAGVRLVCPDRPGYGLSTYHPNRRLVDWPSDVAYLADHLGIERFAVMGISGGGPHAAVCAALLPDRVTAAAIVSGVGPLGDPRALEGMMRPNRILAELSRRGSWLLRVLMAAQVAAARRWPTKAIDFMAKQLPPADVAILGRREVRSMFERESARSSRTAARAATQDFELFANDWGFELGDITVPVHVWQGTADVNVPPAHARLQSDEIDGAVLHEIERAGHMMVIDHVAEILAPLVDR